MIKIVALVSLQGLLLTMAQLLLKVSLKQFGVFAWSWSYFKNVFLNPIFLFAGISAASAMLFWMYLLKKYEFSIIYPLTGISFIFGVMAAQWILHEPVPLSRWIGVCIIIVGVYFVAK